MPWELSVRAMAVGWHKLLRPFRCFEVNTKRCSPPSHNPVAASRSFLARENYGEKAAGLYPGSEALLRCGVSC